MATAQASFKLLLDKELHKRMRQLLEKTRKVTVWEKGQAQRTHFKCFQYFEKSKSISCELHDNPEQKSELLGKSLLINIEIVGVKYFGKCRLEYDDKGHYHIINIDELYKSERRKNFRLLTYPHFDIYGVLDLGKNFSKKEEGQILDFTKNNAEYSDIFSSFLSFVHDSENISSNEKQVVFRVHDLSVSGLGVKVGTLESNYFDEGRTFVEIDLVFSDEKFRIPEARVVYMQEHNNGPLKNVDEIKIGLQYINPSEQLDNDLARKINSLLRDTDVDESFEDFIT